MYNFVFFTDSQADDRVLSFRLDDFGQTILGKIEFVIETANAGDMDVFCGGDFIDRPYITYPYLNRLIQVLSKLKGKFYLILGNHDIVGRNLDSSHKTAIGILEKAGVIEILNGRTAIEGFYITPLHYTEDHVPSLYCCDDPTIFISHNMIVPKNLPFEHLLPSAISPHIRNPSSLVLSGHSHIPFQMVSDGIRFLNPGSLGRVSRDPGEANRVPRILVLGLNNGNCTKIQSIDVPSLSALEVFILKELEESTPSIDLSNLRKLIHSTRSQSFNIAEFIKSIGSEKKIHNSILNESLKRISAAEEAFSGITGQ